MDDRVPARRHVGRGQRRAVVKFDPVADLEGVGLPVIARLRHRGAQIADEIRGRGRVLRIDPDQDAVKRRRGMDRRVGGLAVAIEAWRGVGRDHVGQHPALFRRLLVRVAPAQPLYEDAPEPSALILCSFSALLLPACVAVTIGLNTLHANLAAGDPVGRPHLAQLGRRPLAAFYRDRAARMKHATRGRVDWARHLAFDRPELARSPRPSDQAPAPPPASAWV